MTFLDLCRAQLGKPYVWGAKGPDAFDCSGLVTWALKECGGPDWRAFHNAQRLWDVLDVTHSPRAGDLAFYGKSPERVSHVTVCLGDVGCGVLGACGGDRTTTSVEIAKKRGAAVKKKRSHLYRSDFLGFRKNPLKET
jgi:murein DD-endopeptidase